MALHNTKFVARELEELARVRAENEELRKRVRELENALATSVVEMKRQMLAMQAAPVRPERGVRRGPKSLPITYNKRPVTDELPAKRDRPAKAREEQNDKPYDVSWQVEHVFDTEGPTAGTECTL